MARRRAVDHDQAPPLLAYIEANKDEERHTDRRKDAEQVIARLYAEQTELIMADQAAPAEIGAVNTAVFEIAAEVAAIEERLAADMEANSGHQFPGQRAALADARSRLVDARSRLDRLTRDAAQRAQRLSEITPDIEAWDDRRHAAGQALRCSRKKRGAVSP